MITEMTLEGPDGQPVVLLDSPAGRTFSRVEGLIGVTAREVITARPSRHGNLNRTRFRDGRPITIAGQIFGQTPEDCWDHYEAIALAFAGAVDTDRLLKWTGKRALQQSVRLVSLEPPIERSRDLIEYMATLRVSDARAVAQAEQTLDGSLLSVSGGGKVYPYTYTRFYTPAGGGAVAFTVGGTVEAYPVFRVFGQATTPRLVLQATGEEFRLDGVIDPGRWIEIDMNARTVVLDDGTDLRHLVNYAVTSWFDLAPGSHTVQMFANNFDASALVRVTWRDAYT
jgi:hypothetical protein